VVLPSAWQIYEVHGLSRGLHERHGDVFDFAAGIAGEFVLDDRLAGEKIAGEPDHLAGRAIRARPGLERMFRLPGGPCGHHKESASPRVARHLT